MDHEGNLHVIEPALVPHICCVQGMQSVDLHAAALVFKRSPSDFDVVSGPLNILLGHSIFPVADELIGESRLYSSAFSTGWLEVLADGASVLMVALIWISSILYTSPRARMQVLVKHHCKMW